MNGQKSPDYALPNELPTPIAEPTVSTYELPTPIAEPTKYPPSPETAPAEYEDFGLATKPPSFVRRFPTFRLWPPRPLRIYWIRGGCDAQGLEGLVHTHVAEGEQ